jgi:hypothetical protein
LGRGYEGLVNIRRCQRPNMKVGIHTFGINRALALIF